MGDDDGRDHRLLTTKYEQLLNQIREQRGFGDFLRAKRANELAPAAKTGPVVAVNVQKSRCDALIMYHTGVVTHIPLPLLAYAHLGKMHSQLNTDPRERPFRTCIEESRILSGRYPKPEGLLGALWKRLVEPIFCAIENEVRVQRLFTMLLT